MSDAWVFMALIWGIAELVSYFRKNEFSRRMKTGAMWSVALASLSSYGMMSADKDSYMYLAGAVFMYSAVAFPVYFYRLKSFDYIKNRFYGALKNENKSGKTMGVIVFQSANGAAQFVAVIAGFFTGVLINSIVVAVIALASQSA